MHDGELPVQPDVAKYLVEGLWTFEYILGSFLKQKLAFDQLRNWSLTDA